MSTNYRLFIVDQTPEPVVSPSGALVMGLGTSTARAVANVADKNFLSFYFENLATSGDNRGMYLRHYISGAGGGGEAARIFSTVNNVAAGTAHGAHISLSFGTSGTVTGQGIAARNTLHMPTTALSSNVTMSAVQAEIWSDGSTSDPGGSTLLSFFRAVNGGDATGAADVDDDAVLFELSGFTNSSGNLFQTGTTINPVAAGSLKIRVGSTLYYIPVMTGPIT